MLLSNFVNSIVQAGETAALIRSVPKLEEISSRLGRLQSISKIGKAEFAFIMFARDFGQVRRTLELVPSTRPYFIELKKGLTEIDSAAGAVKELFAQTHRAKESFMDALQKHTEATRLTEKLGTKESLLSAHELGEAHADAFERFNKLEGAFFKTQMQLGDAVRHFRLMTQRITGWGRSVKFKDISG